jgi:uncharacterized membrane protein (UPF0127 family)
MKGIGKKTVEKSIILALIVISLLLLPVLTVKTGFLPLFAGEYEKSNISLGECDSDSSTQVEAKIAQNTSQKYIGLSRTESLPENEAMLFEFKNSSSHQIAMRNMNFGLDVVYIASDGKINSIETLEKPESFIDYYLTYDSTVGEGKYVLELNKKWTDRKGIESGECVSGLEEIP